MTTSPLSHPWPTVLVVSFTALLSACSSTAASTSDDDAPPQVAEEATEGDELVYGDLSSFTEIWPNPIAHSDFEDADTRDANFDDVTVRQVTCLDGELHNGPRPGLSDRVTPRTAMVFSDLPWRPDHCEPQKLPGSSKTSIAVRCAHEVMLPAVHTRL